MNGSESPINQTNQNVKGTSYSECSSSEKGIKVKYAAEYGTSRGLPVTCESLKLEVVKNLTTLIIKSH